MWTDSFCVHIQIGERERSMHIWRVYAVPSDRNHMLNRQVESFSGMETVPFDVSLRGGKSVGRILKTGLLMVGTSRIRRFFASLLYRGNKSPRTATLRNEEARGATSANRFPRAGQKAEIGQRTKLSGLVKPQQNRQPLAWLPKTKGFRFRYRTKQGDPI